MDSVINKLEKWISVTIDELCYRKEQHDHYYTRWAEADDEISTQDLNHIEKCVKYHYQGLVRAKEDYVRLTAELEWLTFYDAETVPAAEREYPDYNADYAVQKAVGNYWTGRQLEEKCDTEFGRQIGSAQRQAAYDELGYLMYWCDVEATGEW